MMDLPPKAIRPPTRKMIIANAGSGKTWSLSSEFARWCLENLSRTGRVGSDRILALTFTRKAAREILEAIVSRLVTAREHPDSAEFAALGSPNKDDLDCVIRDIAQNISRLQVMFGKVYVQSKRTFATNGLPGIAKRHRGIS